MRISNFHGKVVKKKKFLYQPSTSSHHHHIIICSCCVSRGILLIDIWPFSVCSSSTLNEEMISHTYYSPCFLLLCSSSCVILFCIRETCFFFLLLDRRLDYNWTWILLCWSWSFIFCYLCGLSPFSHSHQFLFFTKITTGLHFDFMCSFPHHLHPH